MNEKKRRIRDLIGVYIVVFFALFAFGGRVAELTAATATATDPTEEGLKLDKGKKGDAEFEYFLVPQEVYTSSDVVFQFCMLNRGRTNTLTNDPLGKIVSPYHFSFLSGIFHPIW